MLYFIIFYYSIFIFVYYFLILYCIHFRVFGDHIGTNSVGAMHAVIPLSKCLTALVKLVKLLMR